MLPSLLLLIAGKPMERERRKVPLDMADRAPKLEVATPHPAPPTSDPKVLPSLAAPSGVRVGNKGDLLGEVSGGEEA